MGMQCEYYTVICWIVTRDTAVSYWPIEKKSVTETTISIVERWKKSIGYLFVLECDHAQPGKVIQVNFSFFNFVICRTTRFVEIQQFCYHGNVT